MAGNARKEMYTAQHVLRSRTYVSRNAELKLEGNERMDFLRGSHRGIGLPGPKGRFGVGATKVAEPEKRPPPKEDQDKENPQPAK